MKLVKQLTISLIILVSLSSFGLINNSMLLQKNNISQSKVDSLHNESKSKSLSETMVIKQTSQQKEINKQEQEEEKSAFTLLNKVAYVILLGIKSILTLVVKLFML